MSAPCARAYFCGRVLGIRKIRHRVPHHTHAKPPREWELGWRTQESTPLNKQGPKL